VLSAYARLRLTGLLAVTLAIALSNAPTRATEPVAGKPVNPASSPPADDDLDLLEFLGGIDAANDDEDWLEFLKNTDIGKVAKSKAPADPPGGKGK
jgi:hypothetical protein